MGEWSVLLFFTILLFWDAKATRPFSSSSSAGGKLHLILWSENGRSYLLGQGTEMGHRQMRLQHRHRRKPRTPPPPQANVSKHYDRRLPPPPLPHPHSPLPVSQSPPPPPAPGFPPSSFAFLPCPPYFSVSPPKHH